MRIKFPLSENCFFFVLQFNSTTQKSIFQSTEEINNATNELYNELEATLQERSSQLLRENNDALKQNELKVHFFQERY